jgi:hypothetical protein
MCHRSVAYPVMKSDAKVAEQQKMMASQTHTHMTHTYCFITLKPLNKCYNGNTADTLITATLIRTREGRAPVGSADDDDYSRA